MIIDTVAIKLNSPDMYFENKSYPSGLEPAKNPIYTYGYQDSDYPVITLPKAIFDGEGDSISDGYYAVILSEDKKFLLLAQSGILKAKVAVAKYIESKPTQEEAAELDDIKARLENAKLKKKWKKYKQAEKDLNDYNTRQQAKMSADIFDSGQGYYILKYYKQNERAWGIISK